MTPEEITKLAEEYGVDKANCISFSAYSDAKVKRMIVTKRFANEAVRVLTWLSEHYCIAEKSKVESVEEVTIDGWVARDSNGTLWICSEEPQRYSDWWIIDTNEEYTKKELPSYLFPSLTWESDPLEVTITIKPTNRQWKQ